MIETTWHAVTIAVNRSGLSVNWSQTSTSCNCWIVNMSLTVDSKRSQLTVVPSLAVRRQSPRAGAAGEKEHSIAIRRVDARLAVLTAELLDLE